MVSPPCRSQRVVGPVNGVVIEGSADQLMASCKCPNLHAVKLGVVWLKDLASGMDLDLTQIIILFLASESGMIQDQFILKAPTCLCTVCSCL